MNNKRATKRALLTSIMALVMCVVMLVGTTFAWFTDTASTAVNKIQAGNLDIELQMKDNNGKWVNAEGKTLPFLVKGEIPAEGTQILWEPGCTYYVPQIRVLNKGNLAVKFEYVPEALGVTGKLAEVLTFTAKTFDEEGNEDSDINIEPEVLKPGEASPAWSFGYHMDENAGNEYQNATATGMCVTVLATQASYEKDSFDDQYDKDAEYPISVTTGDELQAIVSSATAPVNIMLTNSITTNNFVIPEDKDVTLDLNGRTVTNAGSHTILNKGHLTLTDSSADKSGQIISLKGNTAALRNGDNAVCVVEGGTISRDGANGNTWHVVENFGKMTFNGGKVVLKNGNGFAITNGWNYFDPGASTTHAVMEINALELDTDSSGIKNCRYGDLTVNDVTVASTGYWALSNDYLGTAVINGGTLTSTAFKAVSNGAAMTVNGGTFDGTNGLFVQSYATSTVLNGGTFTNMSVDALSSYVGTGHTAQQSGTSVIIK
ncbi:MAG: SipW-dependent-type signal peptide-containing protein [Oscillospiraceae bacterium]